MASVPVLTLDLARRLERLVAPEITATVADAKVSERPVVAFGGAVASKARGGQPANKVFCFGHEDLVRLDEILAWYAADHLEPTVYLAPMGFTPALAAALTAAGFAQTQFEEAILYGLATADVPANPPDVTIERVTEANLEAFVQTTAGGFEWHPAWRENAMAGVRAGFKASAYHFLARWRGEPAGVASLGWRDGVPNLCAGAVLPHLRGRGCHLALLWHRLALAHELGATLVTGAASYGSGSFRNQQRVGLRLAYLESAWSRAQMGTPR